MKRYLVMMLMLVGIIGLVACSSGETGKQSDSTNNGPANNLKDDNNANETEEVDEITAWAWDQAFNVAALEYAKDAYNSDGEIDLKVIENAQDDIIQKLNTGLSSGTMSGMPNIVLIEDYRIQSFLEAYPDAFYPVTDYIDTDDFADYKIVTTNHDGDQYGVPFDSGVAGLFVRTDYLAEAGYTPEDLMDITWQEYIEIGKDVKEATGKVMLTLDPNDLGQIRMMIQGSGSWYVTEDGETPYLADNDALHEAFEVYKGMIDAEIVKLISDWSQFVGGVNSGDAASVPTGNWFTISIKGEESQSGDWALVPVPKLTQEGSVNATNLGGSSWYVLNIDGKEKAAEFLAETFGSNADLYQTLVKDINAIGTYLPAAGGEGYTVEDEFFGGQNIITEFASWNDEIPAVNYGLHTYEIEDILVAEMQNYLNGKDLSDVLSDAQTQAETQLK